METIKPELKLEKCDILDLPFNLRATVIESFPNRTKFYRIRQTAFPIDAADLPQTFKVIGADSFFLYGFYNIVPPKNPKTQKTKGKK